MISIIIPTRDRAALLGSAILSLVSQCKSIQESEVIIVDNGSIDNTELVSAALGALFANYTYVHEPTPGLHSARHRGCSVARGSILAFLDDDVEVSDGWLSAIYENFQNADLALLGGNNIPVFFGAPPRWLNSLWGSDEQVRSLSWLSIHEQPNGIYPISPYMVWGCNFIIRKQVLLDSGGFHPDGMPQELIRFRGDGETYVSNYVAINHLSCMFDSRASVYHKVTPERMKLEYIRKRGFNQGVSDSYTSIRNPPKNPLQSHVHEHKINLLYLRSRLRSVKRHFLNLTAFAGSSLNPAQVAFNDGYTEGFSYHQSAYASDPEVKAWVHRQDYF